MQALSRLSYTSIPVFYHFGGKMQYKKQKKVTVYGYVHGQPGLGQFVLALVVNQYPLVKMRGRFLYGI